MFNAESNGLFCRQVKTNNIDNVFYGENRLFFKTGESYWNKFEGFALTAFGSKPKERLEEISCTPDGDSQSSLERKLATLQNKNLVVKLAWRISMSIWFYLSRQTKLAELRIIYIRSGRLAANIARRTKSNRKKL